MRRYGIARIQCIIAITWLLLVSSLLTAAPTLAAMSKPLTLSSTDTLTLALSNGTSFVYAGQPGGTVAPQFTATLVLAAKPTANRFMQVIISVGSQTFGNASNPTVSSDGLTYTFSINSAGIIIPAGSQTAVASFYDASTQTTVHSNVVAFTIMPATPHPSCPIDNYSFVNDPGQTLRFRMSFDGENPNAPVDWQHATYQIRFVGNTPANTFTSGVLYPDSQDTVTVSAPPQFDWYMRIDCTFNGTTNFTSATAQAASWPVLVSAKHPLGPVQFTSVPWPLVVNQSAQVDVIFHAAPGGPVPNGFFSIRVGNATTHFVPVGPNGETKGTLPPLSSLTGITQVFVDYQGDPYYNAASVAFPMTNAPTSGGSGGGSSSGSSGSAKPTATVTLTPGSSATPTVQGDISRASGLWTTPGAHNAGGIDLPWWLILLSVVLGALVLVGGGVGGWLYLSRRAMGSQARRQGESG